MTSTDEKAGGKVPGLLEVLALVPGPRKRRGRRYRPALILAVVAACALSGARNFREADDHARDLPQDVLAGLGGMPHPLLRRIIGSAYCADADQLGLINEAMDGIRAWP